MQVLSELETIDDDCDKHGIQFVKIDDDSAAKEFGIDDVPALVYFEKGIPNVYDGNYMYKGSLYINSKIYKKLINKCIEV
jgi:hypothetical protein